MFLGDSELARKKIEAIFKHVQNTHSKVGPQFTRLETRPGNLGHARPFCACLHDCVQAWPPIITE